MIIKLLVIMTVLFVGLRINALSASWIEKLGVAKEVGSSRIFQLQKTFQFFIFCTVAIIVAATLGVGFADVDIFVSSVFAVIGIALFAQWSILSNLTASVIIFFFFPYKVGDEIIIWDKDREKCVGGVLREITLFHLILEMADGDKLTMPTTMVFQNLIAIKKDS
ncbi:mechanosensitive ion channel domain-containing protein [Dasania marina]|uniref:mechanosensitive ion channel domain-containing protein n=1 Tax=Dasania marina TaxID=471499 RepID=UPI00036BB6CE|nr:mechanosensitive ion channel domain-containing protein [Dasania marina]